MLSTEGVAARERLWAQATAPETPDSRVRWKRLIGITSWWKIDALYGYRPQMKLRIAASGW